MIEITQKLLPVNTKRRPGIKIQGVKFIVAHDTGNDGSTAMTNVKYYIQSANEMEASAHYFVDDQQIICCIPETEKAYHVRRVVPGDNARYHSDAIDTSFGIELCYGSKWHSSRNVKAYENYCALFADICHRYNLNPDTDIIGHSQLDPSRRTDPMNAFGHIGISWTQFIEDVKSKIPVVVVPEPVPVVEVPEVVVHEPEVVVVAPVEVQKQPEIAPGATQKRNWMLELINLIISLIKRK